MEKQELGRQIYEVSHLTGEFLLRSGQTSSHYFDKYRFEANPLILKQVAKHMAPLVPSETEALAGLEMGGIPIATALSLETGLPCVFVRKEAKSYGTCKFAEGQEIEGKNLLVIEDVVTSGGQLIQSTKDLRTSGAQIESSLCVILRQPSAVQTLADNGIALSPLFAMEELMDLGKSNK